MTATALCPQPRAPRARAGLAHARWAAGLKSRLRAVAKAEEGSPPSRSSSEASLLLGHTDTPRAPAGIPAAEGGQASWGQTAAKLDSSGRGSFSGVGVGRRRSRPARLGVSL